MKSAYGRQTPAPDYELTCVEPGSPMVELLRRYWQPVCPSDEVRDLPKKVKLLGEEIVVFRDKKGRLGALEPHCAHRGALSTCSRACSDAAPAAAGSRR
jgi:tert-butyl alcohol monooxygenase / tert-amyl alcohol desaturase